MGLWFGMVGGKQRLCLSVFEENLSRLSGSRPSDNELLELAREELNAYLSAMKDDPLLPQ